VRGSVRTTRVLAVLALAWLIGTGHVFAQAGTASLRGTVTDDQGGALPGATVTASSSATGAARTTVTDASGVYQLLALPPGAYDVKVELSGFRTAVRQQVTLAVDSSSKLDMTLQIGSLSETVNVTTEVSPLNTTDASLGNVITGQQLSQLASNGRSLYTMVNLTTGASNLQGDFQTPTPVGGDANVSFNGNRPSHNIYLLDGGENLDRGGAGTFSVMPSVEALAEFRILSSNYDAQYGLSSAATMTTVLKSGTKTFHASAWEYLRNDWLDARKYTQPVKPTLRFNTYGLNVGGQAPFGKDHPTFFFYNMEWRKLRQGGPQR